MAPVSVVTPGSFIYAPHDVCLRTTDGQRVLFWKATLRSNAQYFANVLDDSIVEHQLDASTAGGESKIDTIDIDVTAEVARVVLTRMWRLTDLPNPTHYAQTWNDSTDTSWGSPNPTPPQPTLPFDTCFAALTASSKWAADGVLNSLKGELWRYQGTSEALRAYALCCSPLFDFRSEAPKVAYNLRDATSVFDESLRKDALDISGADLLRLRMYQIGWKSLGWRHEPVSALDAFLSETEARDRGADGEPITLPETFQDVTGDLIVQSKEGIQFRVHKIFLVTASPGKLGAMILKATESGPFIDGVPTILLDQEYGLDVMRLLWEILPIPKQEASLDYLCSVIEIAQRVDVPVVVNSLKSQLFRARHLRMRPFRLFGFASKMDFQEERSLALRYAIRLDPLQATVKDDFEDMTAADVLELVSSRETASKQVETLVDKVTRLFPDAIRCNHNHSATRFRGESMDALLGEHLRMLSETRGPVHNMEGWLADFIMRLGLAGQPIFCRDCFKKPITYSRPAPPAPNRLALLLDGLREIFGPGHEDEEVVDWLPRPGQGGRDQLYDA